MGRRRRTIPAKFGQKLKAIRENLGLTGEQMIERLDCPSIALHAASITYYEQGQREPPLIVILKYARLVRVHVDDLIDDEVDLPF